MSKLITPKTHPNHDVVGNLYKGWDGNMYRCISYDPSCGYWMQNIEDKKDTRNISERAIGNTFRKKECYFDKHDIKDFAIWELRTLLQKYPSPKDWCYVDAFHKAKELVEK